MLLYKSKAFDSIRHNNLLSKLHLLGVSASALAWFKSYLSLRKQLVMIGSDLSAHYAACDLLEHQRLGWKLKRFDHFKLRRITWKGLPIEHRAQQLRMHFIMLGISWKESFVYHASNSFQKHYPRKSPRKSGILSIVSWNQVKTQLGMNLMF